MFDSDDRRTTVTEMEPVQVENDSSGDGDSHSCPITIRTFALQLRNTTVHVCSWGAGILRFLVQQDDEQKSIVDIVCGYQSVEDIHLSKNPYYFHSCVGRVANRIARGKFSLGGLHYQVPVNNGPNALHGGPGGLSHRNWEAMGIEDGVRFTFLSPDGDQGFPGTVQFTASYRLQPSLSDSGVTLQLHMEALLLDDTSATPINMAHHSYFNLMGRSTSGILEHSLQINADAYTPINRDGIPTKLLQSLDDDPVMDFRYPRTLQKALHEYGVHKVGFSSMDIDCHMSDRDKPISSGPYGIDHNYVVRQQPGMSLPRVSTLSCPFLSLTIYSDTPGIQCYTANYLGSDGESIHGMKELYRRWDAVCLETQHFPDSICDDISNLSSPFWKGKCPILTPGHPQYSHTVAYQLEKSLTWQKAYQGSDTEGNKYDSIEAMWDDQDLSTWYQRAKEWYEDNCDTTVDGVLGGIGYISDQDLKGSKEFCIDLDIPCDEDGRKWSCEVGAGIGRVTKGLLLDLVDRCDLIESSSRLLQAAPDHIGSHACRCRFYCHELQEWKPSQKYSIIWIQWVLCYLTDKDIVEFLSRCSDRLLKNGWIILKENTCENEAFVVDVDDASITRSVPYWLDLISKSGLRVRKMQWQNDFPDEIYPVPMLALQRG
ncbi:aldose 1-epimerase [Nitzschia inconspicua]|uniref:Aldose 1-epimerase n=1 Tax=Nitzschia inconspicua TaxID=303405 RepID=A0A9K3LH46_9STRA|nr:aldose 1-epimerase [Nitzschia inconspicua]